MFKFPKFPKPFASFSNSCPQLKGTLGEGTGDHLLAMLVLFVIWLHIELAPVFGIAASPQSHPQVVTVLFNPTGCVQEPTASLRAPTTECSAQVVCVSVCVSPYVWAPSASGIR